MRWKIIRPKYFNQTKETSWFAILPVKINDEIRWLERVKVKWVVILCRNIDDVDYFKWKKEKFID